MKPIKIAGLAVIFALLVSTMAPALAMPPNSGMDDSSPPDFPLIVNGKIVQEDAILTDENLIIVNGAGYINQTYTMKVSEDPYGNKTEFVKLFKEGEQPDIWVHMIPGDNMLGVHAYAHNFSKGESLAQKIIDGDLEGHYSFLGQKLENKKVGVVIFNKVRAASVPPGLPDYSFMANWDLEKTYVRDFEKIVEYISDSTGIKKHIVIGHSRGGEMAQVYADSNPKYLEGVYALDVIGEYNPESQEYQYAIKTLNALEDYMAQGNYISNISDLLTVLWLSENYPDCFSPVPGFESFTNELVALWMLENTGMLPGPLTSTTGLPDTWYLTNYCAGDLGGLYHTDLTVLYEINNAGGLYPITPLAIDKQSLEKRTHGGADGKGFKVDFGNWKNNIFYVSINAEYGFGPDQFTESLLSIKHYIFIVLNNLGHLDILDLK